MAAALALLSAPSASADPSGWCEWSPELDVNSCGLVVGVPPTGQQVDDPADWSTPETRTKG
ncbi:hypothetical protein [Mycobacteroides abscessus]|uniref:hypothetical protein n=1 Tax=Mycobacteroides abscessus TaxID=36809 RepID=UPI001042D6F7|nr:hypothetical protein [Mycobacteroides abscessus]